MSPRSDLNLAHDHGDDEPEDHPSDECVDGDGWMRYLVVERAQRVVDHVRDDQRSDAPGAAEQPDRGGRPQQEDVYRVSWRRIIGPSADILCDTGDMEWLSAAEAAGELGVSERQVRRLAQAGLLPAQRLGDVWLVNAFAVRDRARIVPVSGRPLSAPMAWAVLMVVDSALHDPRGSNELHLQHALKHIADRSNRHRLRSRVAAAPAQERWAHWLARRATRRRVWVHPGVLDRIVADPRLRPGGGFAAAARGAGIAAGPPRRFYVDDHDVDAVLDDYKARLDTEGDIELMVITSDVPAAFLPPASEPVPLPVALTDLLDSADAREQHVATEQLGRARDALRSTA